MVDLVEEEVMQPGVEGEEDTKETIISTWETISTSITRPLEFSAISKMIKKNVFWKLTLRQSYFSKTLSTVLAKH